jgi:hypothetical protein
MLIVVHMYEVKFKHVKYQPFLWMKDSPDGFNVKQPDGPTLRGHRWAASRK